MQRNQTKYQFFDNHKDFIFMEYLQAIGLCVIGFLAAIQYRWWNIKATFRRW